MSLVTDWGRWHEAYDDPDSVLSRRLGVVRTRIRVALAALGPGDRRILSLCAGDGRDLLPVLSELAPERRPVAVLVELDEHLAHNASSESTARGLDTVRVLTGDAGDSSLYRDVLPVDLLMLCGIFGNITEADIRATIDAVPAMLRPQGFVLWTRGNQDPELRPTIRQWFTDMGAREISYDGEPEAYGVGVSQTRDTAPDRPLPDPLFTFVR